MISGIIYGCFDIISRAGENLTCAWIVETCTRENGKVYKNRCFAMIASMLKSKVKFFYGEFSFNKSSLSFAIGFFYRISIMLQPSTICREIYSLF